MAAIGFRTPARSPWLRQQHRCLASSAIYPRFVLEKARCGSVVIVDSQTGKSCFDVTEHVLRSAQAAAKGSRPAISKALGATQNPRVLDCTGGWARDAIFICGRGAQVDVVERNPLLVKCVQHALQSQAVKAAMSSFRGQISSFTCCDTVELLSSRQNEQVWDVLMVDPMFPERKKSSAAVKLPAQILQALALQDKIMSATSLASERFNELVRKFETAAIGDCGALYLDAVRDIWQPSLGESSFVGNDSSELANAAWASCKQMMSCGLRPRLVVKRPRNASPIVGFLPKRPNFSVPGKAVRFDVYIP